MVAIIGPNGAGKTTMLQLVLGLVTPSAGQVQVFDTGQYRDARGQMLLHARADGYDFVFSIDR